MGKKSNRCYIEVWRDKNFEGEGLRIYGPGEFRNLRFKNTHWGDRISSLRVGPHAFVLAYRDRDFKNKMIAFGPNQSIADLNHVKFNNKIDSIQVINSLKILDQLYSEDAVEGDDLIEHQETAEKQQTTRKKRTRTKKL